MYFRAIIYSQGTRLKYFEVSKFQISWGMPDIIPDISVNNRGWAQTCV